MSRRIYDMAALSGQLYDILADTPVCCHHGIRGLTIHGVAESLDVPIGIARGVIRQQRLLFGDDDEINIPIHMCGKQHFYHLSASIEAGERWQTRRMRNELAQLRVSIAWWQSLSRAHPDDRFIKLNLAALGEVETRIKLMLGELPV